MKAPERSWLLQQLDGWEAEGLITADSARVLRERFKQYGAASTGSGSLMLGIVGALLIGAGLIVLISHNWHEFSRPQRLACAFAPLLLAQLWTVSLMWSGGVEKWKLESAALLQTLTTGSCIAVVSQIYHIGGAWTQFLLIWCLLTLPLAWTLRARFVAVFYVLGIGTWSLGQVRVSEPWHLTPWMYPLLLFALWPYCPGFRLQCTPDLLLRRALTLSAAGGIAACSFHACLNGGLPPAQDEGSALWLTLLGTAGLCLFPLSKAGLAESLSAKPHVVLPSIALLGYAFAGTFIQNSKEFTTAAVSGVAMNWGRLLMLIFAVLALVAIRQRRFALLSLVVIPVLPLGAAILPVSLSILSSLHLAVVGLTLIVLDFHGKPSSPRSGAAILTILIFFRMADSQFSLVTKGLVFVGVGIAFLTFNQFMSRRKKNQEALVL